jgi:hypothetical protein
MTTERKIPGTFTPLLFLGFKIIFVLKQLECKYVKCTFPFLHNTRYRLFRVLGTDLELNTNDISETARYCLYSFATFRSLTFYLVSALTSYRIQLYKLRKSITERYFHETFALLTFYAA